MVSEFNPLIGFTFNTKIAINLNDATRIVVHVIIGPSVVLKFDKLGSSGYDGAVLIDSTYLNKCYVCATPDQAEKIKVGELLGEIEVRIAYPGYPQGRKIKAVAKLKRISYATTIK